MAHLHLYQIKLYQCTTLRVQLYNNTSLPEYNSTITHVYQITTLPDQIEAYNSTKLQFFRNTALREHLYHFVTLPDCNSTKF